MKILIAEDDPTIRGNLLRTLRLEGFDPIAVENGRLALEQLQTVVPALILSDVQMPELDGHRLLQAVRADPRLAGLPFVFLTARADRSDVREGMNLGADDYLTKPFQREELLSMVRSQLARSAQRSEATQRLQQEAHRLRHYDPLTDLPNRETFAERVQASIAAAARTSARLALASIGVEGLSEYRHAHGPRATDEVIRALADRLFAVTQQLPALRPLLGRVGEERFALLLHDVGKDSEVETELRRFLAAAGHVHTASGAELYLSPFAGVSIYPNDAQDADGLLQHAEAAEPPPSPSGALAFFCRESNARMGRRVQLLQALHHALERNELSLCYQPQVSIKSGRVVGFEALIRWQHPEFGFVSPGEFIPIAEESGLVVPIGAWVMEVAAKQMYSWLSAGLGPMRIAVNLSARQFAEDDLVARVDRVLHETHLPAAALELEITESIAMQSAERTLAILRNLKALGVHMAMDDFGTGYSSLAYLKRYPLDALKIDQLFVRNLTADPGDAAITRAVIALAKSLDLLVIAEGVETAAHVDALAGLGCDVCQGYHFAKPLPAAAATEWLEVRRREMV